MTPHRERYRPSFQRDRREQRVKHHVCPAYHRSPVTLKRHPDRPAFLSSRLHREQTGSTTRSQAPPVWWTVSAHRPGAVHPQKMQAMTAPPYTAPRAVDQ